MLFQIDLVNDEHVSLFRTITKFVNEIEENKYEKSKSLSDETFYCKLSNPYLTQFAEKLAKTKSTKITFVKGVFLLVMVLIVILTGSVTFLSIKLSSVSDEFNNILTNRQLIATKTKNIYSLFNQYFQYYQIRNYPEQFLQIQNYNMSKIQH